MCVCVCVCVCVREREREERERERERSRMRAGGRNVIDKYVCVLVCLLHNALSGFCLRLPYGMRYCATHEDRTKPVLAYVGADDMVA